MSNNATVITMNTTAMIPELTTLRERLQDVTSPSPWPTDDVFPAEEVTHPLMWIPYVVLGGVLILLAVASFVHYHVQNRGKYEEQKYKAKAGLESGPVNRKYRVTLNINGAPYTVGKIAIESLSAAETESELPPEPPLANGKIPSYRSAINLPPIGEVGLVHNNKKAAAVRHEDSSDTLSSRERHHRTGHSSPEAQCSYVNEAFDSSGDSEKSLISREMLKRQRKMEKHRQQQQQQHSRQMETLSSDLEADERSGESNDAFGDAAKTRRKPKQKYSSGNSQRSGMVMPVLPDRGSQQQQQQQQQQQHRHQQQQKPTGRPRKFSDPTSRVHPGIDSSRDSLQSDTYSITA